MNNIVMGIPGRTMADSLKIVLEKTGNFRPYLLEKSELSDAVRICKQQMAQQIKQMKQDGMIDTFIYASAGLSYLTAMLEAL